MRNIPEYEIKQIGKETDVGSRFAPAKVILEVKGLSKTFGATIAVDNLSISLYKGEIMGLAGANGAGKSTLVGILGGLIMPDKGQALFEGNMIDLNRYSTAIAQKLGIRIIHQELSLCKNLTVYENFYIEQSKRFLKNLNWRKKAKQMAKSALDSVFPGNNIDVGINLNTLSLAQQQMVEIARATSDPNLKLLILDEPSSSLPAEQTKQLQIYIKQNAKENISFIYVSHRLREIMSLADRIFIMQNGIKKWLGRVDETSVQDMIKRMGEREIKSIFQSDNKVRKDIQFSKKVSIKIKKYTSKKLKDIHLEVFGGEIIGLAGLEGNGQLELLHDIFYAREKKKGNIKINGTVAYITGDRKKEGIFPLWPLFDNIIISKIAFEKLYKFLSKAGLNKLVDFWCEKLMIKTTGTGTLISNLSGGNQQKVLIARALTVDADIILLDDPTKGVDVATKMQLYEVFNEISAKGKLIIWRTSDDAEFDMCSKIFVMSFGRLIREFKHGEVNHKELLKVAFLNYEDKVDIYNVKRKKLKFSNTLLPLAVMVILYIICGIFTRSVFSLFGIELLILGLAPFIFATLAQTFIIGLGHIDLGIGAYMGLINVLCASVLHENIILGIAALIIALFVYSLQGVLINTKNIPPIIVTLGMSFVWSGLALTIMERPGGQVPIWLVAALNFNTPILPGVILILIVFIILAVLFYRTKYGTVIRGFGNNDVAMQQSGWSKLRAYWVTYLIAGIFGLMGGAVFSVITGAADANASKTFTLISIAAVVLGGGNLTGGVVTHLGAVLGAISFTLISLLLGVLNVSTDFTAMVQGFILFIILALRLFKKEIEQ